MNFEQKKNTITAALSEKKGSDITILDVTGLTVLADCFIITNAKSAPQVKAIAENVDARMSEQGIEPLRREGMTDGRWVILDYGDIIVHVFNDDTRVLYALEQLWSDGKNIEKITD